MAFSKTSLRLFNLALLFISMMTLASATSHDTQTMNNLDSSKPMVRRDDSINSDDPSSPSDLNSTFPSDTTNYVPKQDLARFWWTSVDYNDDGITFIDLATEESCYDFCEADGADWQSYSWCEEYKVCWCRPGGIETYNPLRSPVYYPVVNIASTFKGTCENILPFSDATKQLSCENIMITTTSGITLLDTSSIRELDDGTHINTSIPGWGDFLQE